MKIALLASDQPAEKRVALVPSVVAKLIKQHEVLFEAGAGQNAGFSDESFLQVGARLFSLLTPEFASQVHVWVCVGRPKKQWQGLMSKSSLLMGLFLAEKEFVSQCPGTVLAYEAIPRISRAQPMDVLSSQANLVGYRAVLEAAFYYPKLMPLMMTAAGSSKPARVWIIGAGVAGLQAIATARRLGAVVFGSDVRWAVKEQIESLGAKFLSLTAEVVAENLGYAQTVSEQGLQEQQAQVAVHIKTMDIVICSAAVFGKKAPILITQEAVIQMQPGSVIVDLACVSGGNCALSSLGKIETLQGVTIVGPENLASSLAMQASQFLAQNVWALLALIKFQQDGSKPILNLEDSIIQSALIKKEEFA
jgi:NAD(P) transhydrogenase subunit alpha